MNEAGEEERKVVRVSGEDAKEEDKEEKKEEEEDKEKEEEA